MVGWLFVFCANVLFFHRMQNKSNVVYCDGIHFQVSAAYVGTCESRRSSLFMCHARYVPLNWVVAISSARKKRRPYEMKFLFLQSC